MWQVANLTTVAVNILNSQYMVQLTYMAALQYNVQTCTYVLSLN